MPSPRYTRRAYIDTARILADMSDNRDLFTATMIDEMFASFVTLYTRDNPRFDVQRFRTAVYEAAQLDRQAPVR